MSPQPVHSRLITIAAREVLRPMGLAQKGRSRTWLDDNGWWLGVVEFQPSGFSKGSYLNVAVMWLWDELDYIAFHKNHRVMWRDPEGIAQFVEFESEQQFAPEARRLAIRARSKVQKNRSVFRTIDDCAQYFAKMRNVMASDRFHGGIAFGLTGRVGEAEEWFDVYLALDDDRDWVMEQKQRIQELKGLVRRSDAFRSRVVDIIRRTRANLGLASTRVIEFDEV
jgi:hypothetical protein